MTEKMPVLFISHGPPSILLMETPVTTFLTQLSHQIPVPKAIICFSAHFEARIPTITSAACPDLIYDFGGPPALFDQTWPASGDPELAEDVKRLLKQSNFNAELNPRRGLDHGVWVPLKLIYPDPTIPVIQISLQTDLGTKHHYALGRALAPLRKKGVLILGSGGAVHNLYEISGHKRDDPPAPFVEPFDQWLDQAITLGDHATVTNYQTQAPSPEQALPFPAEHFLPLPACLGALEPDQKGILIHKSFMYGTLSLSAYKWE